MKLNVIKNKTTIIFDINEEELGQCGGLQIGYQINGKANPRTACGFYGADRILSDKCAIKFYTEQKIEGKNVIGVRIDQKDMDQLVELEKTLQNKAKAAQEEAERKLRDSETKIKVSYQDGEYLSGYMAFGYEAKLLVNAGIAHEVSGWGTHVDSDLVKALGEEFTYQQVLEYTKPAREIKEAAKAKKETERQAKFDEARETGKKVELYRYSADCNDPNEDCNVDIITQYAMPDGSIKVERIHTW